MDKHQHTNQESGLPPAEQAPQIDQAGLESYMRELQLQQNLPLAVIAGVVATLAGAGLWAVITAATGYQIGFMAIGVGLLVGFAVRSAGKGVSQVFGFLGAGLAFLGCAAGNFFAVLYLVAAEYGVTYGEILQGLNVSAIFEVMSATFHPMDLLFYGIAIYEGYKFSFRQLSEEELAQFVTPQEAPAAE